MSDRLLLFMIGSVRKKVSWRNYLSSSFIHTDKFTCDCAFSKIFPLNLHSRVQRLRRRRGFSSLQSSSALGKAFLFGARYLLKISGETVMKGASPRIRLLVIRAAAPFKWNWTITSPAARLACLCHVENRGLRLELSITGEGGEGGGEWLLLAMLINNEMGNLTASLRSLSPPSLLNGTGFRTADMRYCAPTTTTTDHSYTGLFIILLPLFFSIIPSYASAHRHASR